jgi:hypothetical protein
MAKVLTGHKDRFPGSSYYHLRPLRGGGRGQPMDFQAAPADEAVSSSTVQSSGQNLNEMY